MLNAQPYCLCKIMKSICICLFAILSIALLSAAASGEEIGEMRAEIGKLLTLLQTGKTPNVYGAVYHRTSADFKDPKDGAKSVAVELIAEHANRMMKNKGLRLVVEGEVVVDRNIAGVLLKRSGGETEEGLFPAFLFRDDRNRWGFIGLPIPYNSPIIPGLPRDSDDEFYEAALNDPTPYDGVLYEFDKIVKKRYETIAKKLEAQRRALAEQGGAEQPATAPESKPEGKEKPKSESEGRSQ